MRFAAFIMTFERAGLLHGTIQALLAQTLPPEKILVVDNSISDETGHLLQSLKNEKVSYHRVGFNSGPAGAATIGLQILANEGFDWIYWGDDNDPPRDKTVFERLLALTPQLTKAGAIGSIGGKLNKVTGRTRNLRNNELGRVCEVDYIPGGKNFIISSTAVKTGILPSEELFFGFEELDYCLKLKRAGYKIYVDGEKWLASRIRSGRIDPNYKWSGSSLGKPITGRQYYSARNILYVLRWNRLYIAMIFNLFKILAKGVFDFRYGFSHGLKSFRIHSTAVLHFIIGKKYRTDLKL
jgi:GT2 family glycosyltransferase